MLIRRLAGEHLDAHSVVRLQAPFHVCRPGTIDNHDVGRAGALPAEGDPQRDRQEDREEKRPEDRLGMTQTFAESRQHEMTKRSTHRGIVSR
jgi:hypothetical protein